MTNPIESTTRRLWLLCLRKHMKATGEIGRASREAIGEFITELEAAERFNHALQSTLERRCDEIEAAGVRLELEDA